MRRPVKYKTRQAARNRMIAVVTSAVLGVGVIGGAAAAVLLNRDDDGIDGIGGADTQSGVPVVTDTADSTTDNVGADTQTTDAVTDVPTETEAVTEAVTEVVTEAITEPPVVIEQKPAETEAPTVQQGTTVTNVATTKNYKGGYLDLADYTTMTELKQAAQALKADGYTAVMVELKYDNGKLSYKSDVAEAKEYGANPSVAAQKLDAIVDVLHEAGLYVTGRVCALRDDLAAKKAAIFYTRWNMTVLPTAFAEMASRQNSWW